MPSNSNLQDMSRVVACLKVIRRRPFPLPFLCTGLSVPLCVHLCTECPLGGTGGGRAHLGRQEPCAGCSNLQALVSPTTREPAPLHPRSPTSDYVFRRGLCHCCGSCSCMVRQKRSVSAGSKAAPACCSICCRASLMGRDVRSGFSA